MPNELAAPICFLSGLMTIAALIAGMILGSCPRIVEIVRAAFFVLFMVSYTAIWVNHSNSPYNTYTEKAKVIVTDDRTALVELRNGKVINLTRETGLSYHDDEEVTIKVMTRPNIIGNPSETIAVE
jgi:hypothetical protein